MSETTDPTSGITDPMTVTTDQPDYAPGSTAIITADGVEEGGTVTFSIAHIADVGADGIMGTADDLLDSSVSGTGTSWSVTDGGAGDLDGIANGIVTTSWAVNQDALNQAFLTSAVNAATGALATTTFTDGGTNIDGWKNGPAPDAIGGEAWANGNINSSNSHYAEGDSVPIRVLLDGLVAGDTYTITISYATTKGGQHAFDYLTTYDRTLPAGHTALEANPDPTIGTAFTEVSPHSTIGILTDLHVTEGYDQILGNADDIAQIHGVFSMWGANLTGVSGYTLSGSYASDSSTAVTLTYTATDTTAVLAWGAHIASQRVWGNGHGATNVPGAPYHVDVGNAQVSLQATDIQGDPIPTLAIDKQTVDASDPSAIPGDGVSIPIGDTVEWIYKLTNNGEQGSEVSNVVVTDNNGTAGTGDDFHPTFIGGDTDGDGKIDTNETWLYEATGTSVYGPYFNVGTVAGTYTSSSGSQNLSDSDTSSYLGTNTGLTITKDATESSVDSAGDIIHYTITVQNVGNVDLTSVSVVDSFASTGPTRGADIVGDGDNILEPGEKWSYTATHTVSQGEMDAGADLVNVATVYTAQTTPKDDDATTTVVQSKILHIEKDGTVADGTADSTSDVINYTLTVTNTGNAAIAGVVVDDPFTTNEAPVLIGGFNSGDADQDGKLDVNETWHYTASHTVTQGELDSGANINNTATVTGTGATSDDDSASVPVVQSKVLHIVKSAAVADGTADSTSDVINYTLTVTNTGNAAIAGVVVDDPFTTNEAPVLIGGFNSGDADQDGKLDVNETWHYTASHTVTQGELDSGANINNTATVTGTGATSDDDSASVPVVQSKVLHIVKSAAVADGTADSTSDVINYTLTVTNTGNAAIAGVVVDDPFTTNEAPVLIGGFNSGDADQDGKLDVNETWHYTASHTVTQGELDSGANINNTATVTGTGATSDDDSASVGVVQHPNLTITKTANIAGDADQKVDSAADDITYTIRVTNTGNITLTNLTVTDPLDPAAGNIVGTWGSLAPGAHHDFTFTYDVTQADIDNHGAVDGTADDKIHNSATVTDTQSITMSAFADVAIVYTPHITLDKVTTWVDDLGVSHSGDMISVVISPPSAITWTYTLKNDGNVALSFDKVNGLVDDNGTPLNPLDDLHPTYQSGDTGNDGILGVGENWVFTQSGLADQSRYVNTATATAGSTSDGNGGTVTPTATDWSGYHEFFNGKALTQGFWGSHADAWDNIVGNEGNPTKSVIKSGVISAVDVNPSVDDPATLNVDESKYLLLGDVNHDGLANDDLNGDNVHDATDHELWISNALAKAILSSTSTSDARSIMLAQTIAAQLNIDNGVSQPNNLIGEATQWLTNQGSWAGILGSGQGVNIDTNNDGFVDDNAAHTALLGTAIKTSSNAWQKYVDVVDDSTGITEWDRSPGTAGNQEADGEGLKNALMWFNQAQLVTNIGGTKVSWTDGVDVFNIHDNTLDNFWLTLHQTDIAGGGTIDLIGIG